MDNCHPQRNPTANAARQQANTCDGPHRQDNWAASAEEKCAHHDEVNDDRFITAVNRMASKGTGNRRQVASAIHANAVLRMAKSLIAVFMGAAPAVT
jgi:hypothetical protein